MFEHRQEQLEALLKSDTAFRRIYSSHQKLEKRVIAAENGTAPMADVDLNKLKREKLSIKDQLARLMDQAQAA